MEGDKADLENSVRQSRGSGLAFDWFDFNDDENRFGFGETFRSFD